ncbi:MAG: lysozyme inhibitor LprI family protein [Methylobacter sp.]
MNKYIKRIRWFVIFLFYGSVITLSTQAASFDCSKASTTVEKNICSSQELSRLDEKLTMAYQQALRLTSNKELLRHQQLEWLTLIRNTCRDSKCLETAYVERSRKINLTIKKTNLPFSGQWHLALCDKSISEECGGFTVYLIQTGKKICGDHLFATSGGGRLNEGAPRSIIGSVTDNNVADITISSGRNGATFKARAIVNGDVLSWDVIEEIKRGSEDDSALVLDKGNLEREIESDSYEAALSACQGF